MSQLQYTTDYRTYEKSIHYHGYVVAWSGMAQLVAEGLGHVRNNGWTWVSPMGMHEDERGRLS